MEQPAFELSHSMKPLLMAIIDIRTLRNTYDKKSRDYKELDKQLDGLIQRLADDFTSGTPVYHEKFPEKTPFVPLTNEDNKEVSGEYHMAAELRKAVPDEKNETYAFFEHPSQKPTRKHPKPFINPYGKDVEFGGRKTKKTKR
jgi:hypothetical protein